MILLEIFSILSFVVLTVLLFYVASVIFILKKGFSEVIKGMESISKRLDELEKSK